MKNEIKILIADDDSVILDGVEIILKGAGFKNIVKMDNGQAVIRRIKQGDIDLLITDWNMPNSTGIEIVTNLRNSREYSDFPIILMTSRTDRADIITAMNMSVNEYLAKPFEPNTLIEKVHRVLHLK